MRSTHQEPAPYKLPAAWARALQAGETTPGPTEIPTGFKVTKCRAGAPVRRPMVARPPALGTSCTFTQGFNAYNAVKARNTRGL